MYVYIYCFILLCIRLCSVPVGRRRHGADPPAALAPYPTPVGSCHAHKQSGTHRHTYAYAYAYTYTRTHTRTKRVEEMIHNTTLTRDLKGRVKRR